MTDSTRPGAGVVWARVEEGFHVGSRHGVFLGYLDREADGTYLAYDGRSRMVGRFPTLVAAMAAVSSAQPETAAPVTLRQVNEPMGELPGTGVR